ncbi:hypothetical protein CEP53_014088 [Fusarium sp. AF-6]|nr:hypothetical protein CEP53_014088 [Fusarium sp. AF-6]
MDKRFWNTVVVPIYSPEHPHDGNLVLEVRRLKFKTGLAYDQEFQSPATQIADLNKTRTPLPLFESLPSPVPHLFHPRITFTQRRTPTKLPSSMTDILIQDEVYFLFRDWGILPKANIGLENDLPHFGPTYPDGFEPAPSSHT